MIIPYKNFSEIFADYGIEITPSQYKSLETYAKMLTEWNEKMNLTAITDPEGITIKHFLDSILPLKKLDVPHGTSFVDVGTGAGFPGLPMKINRPDIKLTLLDSLNKRVEFLKAVCSETKTDADCIHSRAEDGGRSERYREKFDFAVARAVAAMPVLSEYCLPFVKVGGTFAALKGPGEDLSSAESAIKLLGGEVSDVIEYTLPGGDKRTLIVVGKVKATPEKYPRNSGQIKKKPL
ncbi:MAG: 16S rRNA (guanine(527)-N(7))-methyltransferase RsmG [Oscillospiraceae bacterium]|nr:16S rRNA (guanine(527)-N(7))-methyltransferase RsmG [Oscillospiraceae bacterium]